MINLITAIKPEADPLIRNFGLKKSNKSHVFPIYGNDKYRLITSGTGKIKSAMACLHLFNYNLKNGDSTSNDLYINIGFCGTSCTERMPGDLILANKICDMETKKEYYPDIYFKSKIMEKTLNCSSILIANARPESYSEQYFDMESAGIMEFSQKYLETHQSIIIKIISDYLSPTKIKINFLHELINLNIANLEEIIKSASLFGDSNLYEETILTSEEFEFLKRISLTLKASYAMEAILKTDFIKVKHSGRDIFCILSQFCDMQVNNRKEGKIYFEKIRKHLFS